MPGNARVYVNHLILLTWPGTGGAHNDPEHGPPEPSAAPTAQNGVGPQEG